MIYQLTLTVVFVVDQISFILIPRCLSQDFIYDMTFSFVLWAWYEPSFQRGMQLSTNTFISLIICDTYRTKMNDIFILHMILWKIVSGELSNYVPTEKFINGTQHEMVLKIFRIWHTNLTSLTQPFLDVTKDMQSKCYMWRFWSTQHDEPPTCYK